MNHQTHSLIIGGTRGIGRALVRLFAAQGQRVSVIGRRAPADEDTRLAHVSFRTADLMEREAFSGALDEIVQQQGKLNNLVFLQRYRGKDDNWSGEIETSLTATKNVIEQLQDHFAAGSNGSIVLTSSIIGEFVVDGQSVGYHIAKAGLNQMIRFYAVALGRKGIRVNGVSPGTVLKDESKDFYLKNEKVHDLYKAMTPLGRMGTAEDVAKVIGFLCSADAAFVTGQNLVVDGGLFLQSQEALARQVAGL